MQVISIDGPAEETTALADELIDRLARRGAVGSVRTRTDTESVEGTGTDTARNRRPVRRSVLLDGDRWHGAGEGWRITGDGWGLADALDSLAVDCEYAVVEGYSGHRLPSIVLGDVADHPGDGTVVLTAPTADAIDVSDAVAAVESVDPYETLHSLVARVKRSSDQDKAGAIATFTGRVRQLDHPEDVPTEQLEFEKYDGVAEEKMAALREELEAREGVYEVRLHHKTGVVEAGEDIVHVVVLAGHRTEAFATVEDGINRLKAEVPLFKKEVTVDEEFWAHQR